MIGRAMHMTQEEKTVTSFADDETIPSWAKGMVASLQVLKIVERRNGNVFGGHDTLTRAEVVVLLVRVLMLKRYAIRKWNDNHLARGESWQLSD